MTGHGGEHRFKPSKAQKCAQQSLLVQVAHSPKCAAPVQLREACNPQLSILLGNEEGSDSRSPVTTKFQHASLPQVAYEIMIGSGVIAKNIIHVRFQF